MSRRIPPALGLVVVIAAIRTLYEIVPFVTMFVRDDLPFSWIVVVLAAMGLSQLAAGITIATSSPHARIAVLAWTLASVATLIFARDEFLVGEPAWAFALMAIELLAAPAIVWLVPIVAGDVPLEPRIPRAHIVAGAPPEPPVDASGRRFDVGVVLFGLGLVWILSAVFSRVGTFAVLFRHGFSGGGLVGELVYLGHAVAVGIFAIVAARRMLDPRVEGQHARRALAIFVLVDVVGDLVRTALIVGYQLLGDSIDDRIARTMMTSSIASAILGLIVPLFLWFYAQPALAHRAEGPPPLPAPSRLAAAPAWAMLWLAPLLLTRFFAAKVTDIIGLASGPMMIIGLACAIQGVVHVVASIAVFVAQRSDRERTDGANNTIASPPAGAVRVARIAARIGLVNASLMIAAWLVLVFTQDNDGMGFRTLAPVGPLVLLVASAATMVWALRESSSGSPR